MTIRCSPTFPIVPPSVAFKTPIFHPNINFKTGLKYFFKKAILFHTIAGVRCRGSMYGRSQGRLVASMDFIMLMPGDYITPLRP